MDGDYGAMELMDAAKKSIRKSLFKYIAVSEPQCPIIVKHTLKIIIL